MDTGNDHLVPINYLIVNIVHIQFMIEPYR